MPDMDEVVPNCPQCGKLAFRHGIAFRKRQWRCKDCRKVWAGDYVEVVEKGPEPDEALVAMRAAAGKEKESDSPLVKALRKDGVKKPLAFAKQMGTLEKQFEQRVAVWESKQPKNPGTGPEPGELPIEDESSEKLLGLCRDLLIEYNTRQQAGAK